jgi:4-hydroxybenzoate polyprenyltransferase
MNLWQFFKSLLKNLTLSNLDDYINLIRLNRPIGIWLLLLPCLFGSVLAYKNQASLVSAYQLVFFVILFIIGAAVMRSAGCIINDIFDQKFDILVARTSNRALVAGKITKKQALIALFILLFVGLLILLQFNQKVILLGVFSLFLAIIYPLTKRITYFPQVFLGITYNIGALMASLAILQKITLPIAILYITTIIWTVMYDTIYAYQDIQDDLRIGVKSTAIKFADHGRKILLLLNIIIFSGFILIGITSNFGIFYYFMILLASSYLLTGILKCDFGNPANCLEIFKSNTNFGLMILTAIIFG